MLEVRIEKVQFLLWEWSIWNENGYVTGDVTTFRHTAVRAANRILEIIDNKHRETE